MQYFDRYNREIHAGMLLRCVANGSITLVCAHAGELGIIEDTGDFMRFFPLLSLIPSSPDLSQNRLGLFEILSD